MTPKDPYQEIFEERQRQLTSRLKSTQPQELYEKIIQMGRDLPLLPLEERADSQRVAGCQSVMHIKTQLVDGRFQITAHSDALISKGLAAIAIALYRDLPPQTILRSSCTIAQDLQLEQTLSPTRLGGFGSIIERIQRDALQTLVEIGRLTP